MTYSFLERRVDDQVKEAAVRMQKVIVGIFLLCFIGRISCLVFNLGSGFLRWTFFVDLIEWLVLAIGFFGAKRRNGSLLTSYIVCVILWVVFRGVTIPLAVYQIVITSECVAGRMCAPELQLGDLSPTNALVLTIIEISIATVTWFLMIWSCIVAGNLKKLMDMQVFVKFETPQISTSIMYEATYSHYPQPYEPVYYT